MPLALETFAAVGDAKSALSRPRARYLGGGTLLVRSATEGNLSFDTLVRVTDPALGAITVDKGEASIGAGATMAAVAAHPGLKAIAPAARAVGGPAVRNMASVGGNLFAEAPYGDFAVALLALDATVHLGERKLSIDDLLKDRETVADIVTAVSFKLPAEGSFRFRKVSRVKPKGVSVLTIAAVIEAAGGKVGRARVALGCMADRPIRAKGAEKALVGAELTEEGIAAAVAAVNEGISPITDPIASAWYRAEVLPVHFRRLLVGA